MNLITLLTTAIIILNNSIVAATGRQLAEDLISNEFDQSELLSKLLQTCVASLKPITLSKDNARVFWLKDDKDTLMEQQFFFPTMQVSHVFVCSH